MQAELGICLPSLSLWPLHYGAWGPVGGLEHGRGQAVDTAPHSQLPESCLEYGEGRGVKATHPRIRVQAGQNVTAWTVLLEPGLSAAAAGSGKRSRRTWSRWRGQAMGSALPLEEDPLGILRACFEGLAPPGRLWLFPGRHGRKMAPPRQAGHC